MMTRKDYIAFAKILADARSVANEIARLGTDDYALGAYEGAVHTLKNIAHDMASVFARDNRNFDKARFLAEAGVTA